MTTSQSQPQPPRDREAAKMAALGNLNNAIWNASQYVGLQDLADFCLDVVGDIDADDK